MKNILITFWLLLTPCIVFAEDFDVILEKAPINRNDLESIKRGAQFYATNCLSCHSLVYMRYNKLAQEAGITYEKMPLSVTSWPFGVKPPDLSLETGVRGVDWVYTYLHSFYVDTSRPTGSNNLLFPNVMMPNMLAAYQGQQVISQDLKQSQATYHLAYLSGLHYYDVLTPQTTGSMSPQQFDATMADVVNFLAYAQEPFHAEQTRIGWWVMGFLLILFVLVFLLKQDYWKDVK